MAQEAAVVAAAASAAQGGKWRGKVALVTGCSVGIGRDVARALAVHLGMRVAGCARRRAPLEKLAREVSSQAGSNGGEFLPIVCDLTQDASISDMFAGVDKWSGGRVDVLINNAGMGEEDSILEGRTDAWRRMFEVNCLALLTCTREAVKRMDNSSSSYVINISSTAGHRVCDLGVYSATKYAVRAITEVCRRELRARNSNIRCGEISPGLVETGFALALTKSEQGARKVYESPYLVAPDLTAAVLYMLGAPAGTEINDIIMRPTHQKL